MSKGKARKRDHALAALLADELDDVTELAEYSPDRFDLVDSPATGAPVLLAKSSQVAQAGPVSADAELVAYARNLAKSGDSAMRQRAVNVLEGMGIDPFAQAPAPRPVAQETGTRRIQGRLLKSEPERRFTLLLAYPSDRPDKTTALDKHRDFASFEANEKACWAYTAKSRKIGLWHSSDPSVEGAGTVVESYIWRSDKPWVIKAADGSKQVIRKGDFVIGVIWEPEVWPLVKQGLARGIGVSMQGSATRRRPSPDAIARVRERSAA